MYEYDCEVCKDTGWLDKDGDFIRCECKAESDRLERERRLLRICRLPEGSYDKTFETFKVRPGVEEAYTAAMELAEGGGIQWLTLMSGVDKGKSHLAQAVARRYLERQIPARYCLVPVLLDDLRRCYDPRSEVQYDQEFDLYCDTPLLILDDLGMESPTQWAQEKLDTIVEVRASKKLPLMVTTNLSFDAMSDRIASRLQRYQPGRVVFIQAPEYRVWGVK